LTEGETAIKPIRKIIEQRIKTLEKTVGLTRAFADARIEELEGVLAVLDDTAEKLQKRIEDLDKHYKFNAGYITAMKEILDSLK